MKENLSAKNILEWQLSAGVDEIIANEPLNRFQAVSPVVQEKQMVEKPMPVPVNKEVALLNERTADLLKNVQTLEELRQIILDWTDSSLKKTATNLILGTGNPSSDIMIVGEAPSEQEDMQGQLFVGKSGQLFDAMLASVGFNRQSVYISNVLPWRLPANRKPLDEEISLFLPFLQKQIAIVRPKILFLFGGTPLKALLSETSGITKMRGKWLAYQYEDLTIPVIATFSPDFLLCSPMQKKAVWQDLLLLQKKHKEQI